ncbi:SapC family protein [Massilia sp. TSP1-1-2]|uniref:SapC family protein n=1 Tax=unclassified Massilia TaxID=2609279 RepID=UPI003CF49863
MPHHVLLNNIEHKDVRIVTRRGAAHGDDVMLAITFPAEFRDLQAHYPIVFRKTPDGTGFEPVVLFGFQERENLFLGPNGWDASYVPLAIERQPFLIGITNGEPMVHIDLASPRVSAADGEAIFLAHGGNTEFLEQINSILLGIYQGVQATAPFITALLEHALLESFVVDIELDDGSQNRLAGFYTINEDKLGALPGDAVARLHQAGYLQAIYMVLASMSNFRALIARKNRHA